MNWRSVTLWKYIRTARRDVERGLAALSTGDTDICPRSFEAAVRATGLCLNAVDLVVGGEAQSAFCIVRPPGHHATPNRGMGFCLFNNIAIAARFAQRRYGVERAAIVDWDVHHGNGTQEIFYRDPSVFFFSTHQWPWYPGTGAADETGEGAGAEARSIVPSRRVPGAIGFWARFATGGRRAWMNSSPI